jgi:hypothetical protein
MKTFKDMLSETVKKPRSPDEQHFIDKHIIDKRGHPVAPDDQFSGEIKGSKRKKRIADLEDGEDKQIYEESESEMTPAQKKKREEIVLSLKNKVDEFKSRYGDKAKDVMYATATKMAMKEEAEEVSEGVLEDLKDIVSSKSVKEVKFTDGKKQKVDMNTASMVLNVHKQLNGENKAKVERMLNDSKKFMQIVQFSMNAGK